MMTLNEVMKAYEDAILNDEMAFIVFILVVCLILPFVILSRSLLIAIIFSFISLAITPMVIDYHSGEVKPDRYRQEWVKQYAIPYIEHLPNKKIIVDDYFITNKEDKKSFFTHKVNDFETIEVKGKNEMGLPVSIRINARIQPKDHIQKPYLIYKKLEKNLPYRFQKGYYDATLFIPKNSN